MDEFEQLNIEKAVEWTIHTNLKTEKILTEKFIRNLHKKMYGDVWKWAGEFRRSNKNLGIPWNQIGVELKKLIDDTKYWIEHNVFKPDEIAIRFKHRIVAIHCFPNGNGRHSRLMADIIMESIFKEEIFSWNKSNMVKADETRKAYISALKNADQGDINPLIDFAKH
ncbi:mobile mystery protein B [Algoriphagus sp. AGSA1]|nr:mobile mystery protein B [Algoriphagus sp. AGSA1]